MSRTARRIAIGLSIAALLGLVFYKMYNDEYRWTLGPRAFYEVGSNYFALSGRNKSENLQERVVGGPFQALARCQADVTRWHDTGTFTYECRELLVADVKDGSLPRPEDRNSHESMIP